MGDYSHKGAPCSFAEPQENGSMASYMTTQGAGSIEQGVADALEVALGARLKALRLRQNLGQAGVASRAGVSVGALKHLEGGQGTTVQTLVRVVLALGKDDLLLAISGPGEVPQRRRAHRTPARPPLVRVPVR